MMLASTLSMCGTHHERLRAHLFPGDGLEAAAILLCSRTPGPRTRLLVRDVILVPHPECRRAPDSLTWPGHYIEHAIDLGDRDQLALVLLHSHPGGLFAFSELDDISDQAAIPSLFHALGNLHGSAIMISDGSIRARFYGADLAARPVDLVSVAGHDLHFWWESNAKFGGPSRRPLAFTSEMRGELGRLTAGVIGLSGTGSVGGEALARLGFGSIKAIDFDIVEQRNLDRIVNSTLTDAAERRLKSKIYCEAVTRYRGEGVVESVAASILSRKAVLVASQCDVLFCLVDTLEARHIADLISSAFLIPLFDVGVTIPVRRAADGVAIADVCGRIDYVQPGCSSLWDRGVYTTEGLRAEYLRKVAPEEYARELREGYFRGRIEEAPAVITLNMRAASAAVNEFIARAYPFRLDANKKYARTTFSLAACEEELLAEDEFDASPSSIFARGDVEPLLGLPALVAQVTEDAQPINANSEQGNATTVALA